MMSDQDLSDIGFHTPLIIETSAVASPLRCSIMKVGVLLAVTIMISACGGESPETPASTATLTQETSLTPALVNNPASIPKDTNTPSSVTQLPTIAPLPPTPTPPTPLSSEVTPEIPTSTLTPTPSSTPTVTSTPTPTPTPTSTTTPEVITLDPTSQSPPPQLDLIVYVRGNGPGHDLALATSRGEFIRDLHPRAAAPTWSPNGQQIAFFGEAGFSELPGAIYDQGSGVWLINRDGSNLRQLLMLDYIKSLAWSPDGQSIALEYDHPSAESEIRIINIHDGTIMSRFAGQQPAWNRAGDKLAIKACRLAGCGLWIVSWDGTDIAQKTYNASDGFPTWSSNDRYLAFSSHRDGNAEIYLLDLTTLNAAPINLTKSPMTETTPVFSTEGQKIYFRTDKGGGGVHWFVAAIDLNGNNFSPIISGVGPSDDWGMARPAVTATR